MRFTSFRRVDQRRHNPSLCALSWRGSQERAHHRRVWAQGLLPAERSPRTASGTRSISQTNGIGNRGFTATSSGSHQRAARERPVASRRG